MKLFLALLCVSVAVLVSCDDLTQDYMDQHFAESTDIDSVMETMPRHLYYNYKPTFYEDGQCCLNGGSTRGCYFIRYRPPYYYSYYNNYGGYSNYRKRGCYWYQPQESLIYCLCMSPQTTCTASTTTAPATTTTAAATSTVAATTSTAAPTTTTAAPTTTTAAPTTTTAAPTTTTAAPTTTTAAPTTSTTAATRFCPATATTNPVTRIFGGTTITACSEFPGLVSIVSGGSIVCTGVITGPTTLSMPNNCAQFANGASVVAQDGTVVEANIAVTASGTGGPVEVTLTNAVATNSCPGIACVYSSTMASDIDLGTCRIAAAGYDSNTAVANSGFSYLAIPTLQPTSSCVSALNATAQNFFFDFTNSAITYNCFTSPGGSTCRGDFGGIVVCDLTNGEQVLIGQAENAECTPNTLVGFYNLETASVRVFPADTDVVQLG